MTRENQIGDFIIIEKMEGEPEYTDRAGTIEYIDGAGQLHGDWGGLAVIPGKDIYKTLIRAEKMKKTSKNT